MAGIQQIRSIQWIPNKRSSCRPKKIHSLEFQPILLLSGPFQWTSLVISVPRTSSPLAECAKRCWNWAILDDATLGDCFWTLRRRTGLFWPSKPPVSLLPGQCPHTTSQHGGRRRDRRQIERHAPAALQRRLSTMAHPLLNISKGQEATGQDVVPRRAQGTDEIQAPLHHIIDFLPACNPPGPPGLRRRSTHLRARHTVHPLTDENNTTTSDDPVFSGVFFEFSFQ